MFPVQKKQWSITPFSKLLDIGDFIGIEGYLFKTQVGDLRTCNQIYPFIKNITSATSCKTDEDGKVHDAFVDPELRYRMRYVDLAVNPHVKDIFIKRTKLFNAMRGFFNDKGYFEVETPVLQSILVEQLQDHLLRIIMHWIFLYTFVLQTNYT